LLKNGREESFLCKAFTQCRDRIHFIFVLPAALRLIGR
jgi:hypothetical protein